MVFMIRGVLHQECCSSLTEERCSLRGSGCRWLAGKPWRARMSLWLRKPLAPRQTLRHRSAQLSSRPSRAPFFTACAFSATTCFALPPISSMQNSVLPVTRADCAGKTTTLRMLAAIVESTVCTAVICGHDVVEEPEKVRASVGFLSTATALCPRLTAQELVEYFGRLNGLDEPTLNKRVDDIF